MNETQVALETSDDYPADPDEGEVESAKNAIAELAKSQSKAEAKVMEIAKQLKGAGGEDPNLQAKLVTVEVEIQSIKDKIEIATDVLRKQALKGECELGPACNRRTLRPKT